MARQREIEAALKEVLKAIKDIKKIQKQTQKELKDELEYIADSVVTRWYDSYTRSSYEPGGSLYYAYKIEVNDKGWNVEFSPEFMSKFTYHHQSNELIFHNAFELGYHGGSGSRHLNDYDEDDVAGASSIGSTPWWRTPGPFYPRWYKEAVRTFSPYEEINKLMDKKIKEIKNKRHKKLSDVVSRIENMALFR